MASNIQLQSTVDHVYTLVRGAPLQDVLGVQGEPALGICNDTYQFALQRPLTWRFNKANAGLSGAVLNPASKAQWTNLGVLYWTTVQYQQDYALTNATANVAPTSGGSNPGGGQVHIPTVYNSGLVVAGGVATVTTNWAHSFSPGQTVTMQNVGQWANVNGKGVFTPDNTGNINSSFTIVSCPTTTSFTFATGATTGTYGAPGINDIGWIERAVLEDWACSSTVKPRHSIEVTMNLELESIIQPPFKISYQLSVADAAAASGADVPSNTAIFRLWRRSV